MDNICMHNRSFSISACHNFEYFHTVKRINFEYFHTVKRIVTPFTDEILSEYRVLKNIKSMILSYSPDQGKLFSQAVPLLKYGNEAVYIYDFRPVI